MFKLVVLLTVTVAAFSQTALPAAKPPLAFEVASVKPAPPLDPQKIMSGQQRPGMKVDAARVDINSMSFAGLLYIAFKIKPYQLSGPSWVTAGPMTADLFEVHAKMPEGATEKDVPEMLQALLVERFKLKFHRESSEQAIYALVVGKGGPKMKEAPPDPEPVAAAPGGAPGGPGGEGGSGNDRPPQVSGRPDEKGGATIRGGPMGNMKMAMQDGIMHMEAEKMSMTQLTDMLSQFMDRPVVDLTELKGNFQVAIDIAQADMMNAARRMGAPVPPPGGGIGGPGGAAAAPDASDPAGNSILRSMQQLGLKLEARKSDVGKLVIDHVEKTPSEN
jgi:uncharacterized protein (TIGR03435 family)